jgi:hypothetical protein
VGEIRSTIKNNMKMMNVQIENRATRQENSMRERNKESKLQNEEYR